MLLFSLRAQELGKIAHYIDGGGKLGMAVECIFSFVNNEQLYRETEVKQNKKHLIYR